MPNESGELVCCFGGCKSSSQPSLRIEVYPPSDRNSVIMWAHDNCFASAQNTTVNSDDPAEHGRIPARACCVFCGDALPIIGKHSYCLDVGEHSPPHRFWSHAECMLERVSPQMRERL